MPDVSEIHERLIKAYIVAGMLAEAAEAADKLTSLFASPETFLPAASIRAQLEQWQHTEDLLSAGLKMFPQINRVAERVWRSRTYEVKIRSAGQLTTHQRGQQIRTGYLHP